MPIEMVAVPKYLVELLIGRLRGCTCCERRDDDGRFLRHEDSCPKYLRRELEKTVKKGA